MHFAQIIAQCVQSSGPVPATRLLPLIVALYHIPPPMSSVVNVPVIKRTNFRDLFSNSFVLLEGVIDASFDILWSRYLESCIHYPHIELVVL